MSRPVRSRREVLAAALSGAATAACAQDYAALRRAVIAAYVTQDRSKRPLHALLLRPPVTLLRDAAAEPPSPFTGLVNLMLHEEFVIAGVVRAEALLRPIPIPRANLRVPGGRSIAPIPLPALIGQKPPPEAGAEATFAFPVKDSGGWVLPPRGDISLQVFDLLGERERSWMWSSPVNFTPAAKNLINSARQTVEQRIRDYAIRDRDLVREALRWIQTPVRFEGRWRGASVVPIEALVRADRAAGRSDAELAELKRGEIFHTVVVFTPLAPDARWAPGEKERLRAAVRLSTINDPTGDAPMALPPLRFLELARDLAVEGQPDRSPAVFVFKRTSALIALRLRGVTSASQVDPQWRDLPRPRAIEQCFGENQPIPDNE